MTNCDICNRPFNGSHGVSVHKRRSPNCGIKTNQSLIPNRSSRVTSRVVNKSRECFTPYHGSNGETGKEAIRQILTSHPKGLSNQTIREELKNRGFSITSSTYVSQVAAKDDQLVRVDRGVYRLKNNSIKPPSSVVSVSQVISEVPEAISEISRDALLLRIDNLENQNKALKDAHMSLLRGV